MDLLSELDRQRLALQQQLDQLNKERARILAEQRAAEALKWEQAYMNLLEQIPAQLLKTKDSILFFRCLVCHDDYPRAPLTEFENKIGPWFDNWEVQFVDCGHSVCRTCAVKMLKYVADDLNRVNGLCIQCPVCRREVYTMSVPIKEDVSDTISELAPTDALHLTTPAPPKEESDEEDESDWD